MVRVRSITTAASLALLGACSRPSPNPANPDPLSLPPHAARTSSARQHPVQRTVTAFGSLFPNQLSPINPRVPGHLIHIPTDLGSHVRKGDLLAEIDPREYELRLRQARALLSQARARLGLPIEGGDDAFRLEETSLVRQASAVLTQARAEKERVEALNRQGIAPASDLEAAAAALIVAESRHADALEEARNRAAILEQRRAEVALASQQLADTRILAPFDGVIAERRANLGQQVDLSSILFTLVQADPLRLRLEIPEREASRIQQGQSVRLHLTGDTNAYTGTLTRLSPSLLETSRMLVVEADIPAQGALRPGAFVRAEIIVHPGQPATTIPSEALVTFAGVEKVFLASDGKAVERRINTGDRGPGWIEVTSGLKPGETVILNPAGLVNGRPLSAETNRASAEPRP